jgi:hypothetical protein
MALASIQGYFLAGKGGQCVGLKTLTPSFPDCMEMLGASTCWSPKGPAQTCIYIDLPLLLKIDGILIVH